MSYLFIVSIKEIFSLPRRKNLQKDEYMSTTLFTTLFTTLLFFNLSPYTLLYKKGSLNPILLSESLTVVALCVKIL